MKSHEAETKVAELTVRLENQTLEVLRLQTELEEYEWEDAMTADGSGGTGGGEADGQQSSSQGGGGGYW